MSRKAKVNEILTCFLTHLHIIFFKMFSLPFSSIKNGFCSIFSSIPLLRLIRRSFLLFFICISSGSCFYWIFLLNIFVFQEIIFSLLQDVWEQNMWWFRKCYKISYFFKGRWFLHLQCFSGDTCVPFPGAAFSSSNAGLSP